MSQRVAQQMAQDRIEGNFRVTSYEEQVAHLRELDAENWKRPPLEISPCIRIKATGEVHIWTENFAARSDLCENCDEYGNTDPAAWRGRAPRGVDANGHMVDIYSAQQIAKETQAVQSTQPTDGTPDVGNAHLTLGTQPVPAYTDTTSHVTNMALYVPANEDVAEVMQSNFTENNNLVKLSFRS